MQNGVDYYVKLLNIGDKKDGMTKKVLLGMKKIIASDSQNCHKILPNVILGINLLIAICIGFLRITPGLENNVFILFTVQMVIGIVIVINVLRAKIRDSIGCLQESLVTIFFMILLMTVSPVIQSALPEVF